VERARLRLERTPWRCFWLGGVLAAGLTIPITILLVLPSGAARFAGFALLFLALAGATLGAAGLAAKMGDHVRAQSPGLSRAGAFVRGALALELAAAFPIVGWFVVVPLAVVVALGATAFAVLRWMPRLQAVEMPTASAQTSVN
jgi:hypothetical protein